MAEGGDNQSSDSIASEDLHDNVCYNCKEDGKHLEACGFCLDCGDHLCEKCFQNHRQTKFTKHHRVMTLDQIQAENVAVLPKDTCSDICPKHTDEIVKYFCVLHDVFGCTVCMTVVHRNCEGVEYIPDVSEGLLESTDVTELISDLDTLVGKSENVLKESKENVSLAEATYNQAVEAAEKYCENIIARVKSLLKTTRQKAGTLRDADIKKMDATCKSAETTLEKMKTSRSELDTLRKNQQGCKLFVAMKNVNREMASANERIDELMQSNTVDTYRFQPCHEITSIMADKERDGLGSLSSLPSKPEPVAKLAKRYLGSKVALGDRESKTLAKPTATYVIDIQLYSKSDSARTCCSNGIVSISANRLLMLDEQKILLIDTQKGRVIREFPLEGKPNNLLQLSATQVAVVYNYSGCWKTLELFKIVGTDLLVDRQFSFHPDSNISAFKFVDEQDGFIAIGDRIFQKIGMTGRVSPYVKLGKIDGKQSLMMKEMSNDHQSLYCKTFDTNDWGGEFNTSIRKVDFDGKVSSSDKLSWKKEYIYLIDLAIGLFILTENSIYITSGLSQEPTLLLSESDGIYKPCCLHHCPTTNKLYIGFKDCNFLKVFQLG